MNTITTAIRCSILAVILACHGHSHDEAGHGAKDELPGQSITVWTERHELFMEYRPLIVRREATFAAHVTVLPNKAPSAGTVTVAVEMQGGPPIIGSTTVAKPDGIFRPALKPDRAGTCKLRVTITGAGGGDDTIDGGPCQVFSDEAAAKQALGEEAEPPGRITYLKEQQWKTEFATTPAAPRDLQDGVRANGEIVPVAGQEARLIAPAPGLVSLAQPAPVPGMAVKKGQILGSVAPRLVAAGGDRASLDADVATARAELDGAQAARARAERLFAEQAIPEKQVEEARTKARIALARLDAATGRLAQYMGNTSGRGGAGAGAFQLRSPIDGTLVALAVASNQSVAEGELVMTVMNLDRVWLKVSIFEPDLPRVETARAAWFTLDGREAPFQIDDSNGRVVTLGRVLDPQTRTVPLIFEVANADGKIRVGQFAKVLVQSGPPVKALAIPQSALVEDAGRTVAYVMTSGEAFERRPLALGIRSTGWVEVKEGVREGERVVSRGAYELKLASAAGSLPAHGHAH